MVDLFTEKPPLFTVSELNEAASRALETHFELVWVSGEISNFKRYDSGHCYFSLKDTQAQIRGVMFRHKVQQLDFFPQNGMKVEVLAQPAIYAARGDFQLNVETMRRAGLGALFVAFEALKAKLQEEGLFAQEKKCPLPAFAQTVGIVSSIKGAALHDMLTTLRRRMPSLQVIIYPAAVQGSEAVPELIAAIRKASERKEVDILIVGRGGGSIEDLWAFNDEGVARAIANTSMPVVSAVGHETDFTIADFVADLRAPTPTAAAELISQDQMQLKRRLIQYKNQIALLMRHRLNNLAQQLDLLSSQLISPARKVAQQQMHLQHLASRLQTAKNHYLEKKKQRYQYLSLKLAQSKPDLPQALSVLRQKSQQFLLANQNLLQKRQGLLSTLAAKLEGFDPHSILNRGYTLVRAKNGGIIRSAKHLSLGEEIAVQFIDGEIGAVVAKHNS